ncbi:MAG TPA: S66 peptidase family protein [Oligoflexus sp.]|uniref:S66 family peptidase n=1 Tax=Oligoflexus sp. TaxID=1971216 RepID=UPI002D733514|nr:S66 peptidase family protein [Oligoflexus sp.]HYX37248.1 S66 peptidase family protein [Oligoflexus sp.]
MIRFPAPLRAGSTIAVTAPSSGVLPPYHKRLDIVYEHLKDQGFGIVEGGCLRSDHKHVSAPKEQRAQELMRFWSDSAVDLIFPPWGGELAIDLLPLLDFEQMKASPTWIQGFSDTSTYLLPITLLTGIATSHGTNLIDSVPRQTDELTRNALNILRMQPGVVYRQNSSAMWQKAFADYKVDPGVGYVLTEATDWKILGRNPNGSVSFSGRLIGGCIDTIAFLIGSKFGDVPAFIRTYRDQGVILYLENCDQGPTDLFRYLTHMKLAGWFDGLSGVLLGRSAGPNPSDSNSLQYAEVLEDILGDLQIPVVYDCDIGHVVPQMTLVNGAMAQVFCERGSGWIDQTFA